MKQRKLEDNDNELTPKRIDDAVGEMQRQLKSIPKRIQYAYFLSPENRFAVVKHKRRTAAGQLMASFSNSGFDTVPGTEIEVARKITYAIYQKSAGGKYELSEVPLMTSKMSVTKIDTLDVPENSFVLDKRTITPGAIVIDAVSPNMIGKNGGVITFKMPASPDDLDAVAKKARDEYNRTQI